MPVQSDPLLEFGDFQLDVRRRCLLSRSDGVVVSLTEKMFDALLYLVERAGEICSKSALMKTIWPHVRVEENSLNQCMSSLRRALNDDVSRPRYIGTVPGRGYRFIAEVSESRKAMSGLTNNPVSYQHYLNGWLALTRLGDASLVRAVADLEAAVALDPDFVLALVRLSSTYLLLGAFGVRPYGEVIPKAHATIARAFSIAPNSADVHAQYGHILMAFDLQHAAARRALDRAVELDPRCSVAHHYLGLAALAFGDAAAALDHMQRARMLEPLAANVNANVGLVLYHGGRYAEAVAQCQAALEIDPAFDHARSILGRGLMRMGEFDRAIEEFQRRAGPTMNSDADLPSAYALAGRKDEARAALAALKQQAASRYVSAYAIASIHAALGEAAPALTWLGKAVELRHHPMLFAGVDPAFADIRSKPEFAQVLERLGVLRTDGR
jgi:DNA-binding winged helix-turn-helix (wHTH) protein/predicted Zn-dependent protease